MKESVINIFDLTQLKELFPVEDFAFIKCDNEFKLNETNCHFEVKDSVDKHFSEFSTNKSGLIETSLGCEVVKFAYYDMKFENEEAKAIVFKLKNNNGFFIVLESSPKPFEQGRELRLPNLTSNNAISIFNCIYTINNELKGVSLDEGQQNVLFNMLNKSAKYCFFNIRAYKNVEMYSSLVNNTYQYSFDTQNICEFLKSAVDEIKSIIEQSPKFAIGDVEEAEVDEEAESNVDISFECNTTQNIIKLTFDPYMLEVALIELISNACKFTQDKIYVCVVLENDDDNLYIRVVDKGVGFYNKDVDYCEPFYKHYGFDIDSDFIGLGLGLSITKRIVNGLNGDIHFESNEGTDDKVGSTVVLTIPYDKNLKKGRLRNSSKKVDFDLGSSFSHKKLAFANIFDLKLL